MKRSFLCSAVLAGFVCPALADQTVPLDVSLRVGATKQLWVIAAHRADCSTSDARSVDVVSPPTLGRISQQEGVSVTAKRSISGTCLGARLIGIAVNYTAAQPGTDRFEFDGVFQNGRARYIVTAHNR